MITYATREEEAHHLGIEYVLGEAETMDILGAFDLVTAAYLLVHATTRSQLATMCQAIGKQLKPGGCFVALTINPHLMIDQLPRIEQYQSGVTVPILWFWKPRKEAPYADPTRHPRGSAGHWRSPAF